MDIQSTTWAEVKDEKFDFAVLPWGATEPHNYHLPYTTDCYLAYHIAMDAVQKAHQNYQVRGMVLPVIPMGQQNPGQRELPFCLHMRYKTQYFILHDVLESLQLQGIKRLIILNGHGGNNFRPMIRDLVIDFPDMLIVHCDWFAVTPQKDYFENFDDHAGEMETSVILHYRPELVHLERAGLGESRPFNIESLNQKIGWMPRNWAKISDDTGVGNPLKATAEKGKRYADAVTDKVAYMFNELVNKSLY
ncbi:MAG: creatininase family protein [Tannerella sp.]|jgi:creatinine amidohydrolase|nr:creatininase family protein [Tannerella sp.]